MITYYIQRFIHSTIRENKLFHIIEMLLGDDTREDILLDDFIRQLKSFLEKDNDDLFDDYRLKYLIFLDDFKKNIEGMKDLKDTDAIKMNSILFRIYELPKKRNNLLVIFLTYFYIRNKSKIGGKEIFRMIHIYLMIIAYRNRLSHEKRLDLLDLDQKNFRPISELVQERVRVITRKYRFLKNVFFRYSVGFISMTIGVYYSYIFGNAALLRADVLGTSSSEAFGKVAMDTLFLGRLTDGVMGGIKDIGLQNILIIAVLALIVQAVRNNLTNAVFNGLFTKLFEFIKVGAIALYRLVFALYNYAIYKIETRFIFSSIHVVVSKKIIPNAFLLGLFLFVYVLIYFSIIGLYFLAGLALSGTLLHPAYILAGSAFLTILFIFINLRGDMNNFKAFIIEIEWILSELSGKKEDKKEEIVSV